ncbi:MAG: prephenate dehydrogenase/arogenate dehydrogenase family protein [Desulforhopalus sp.]|nr:prephenate dehydrogenase/arogenate dehydrogenase family protein [Desulforhopalus sp.]
MSKKVVSVYGYGRFGKLWADILSEDFQVKVFSRRGLKPDEVKAGIEVCDAEEIFDCDALFFCIAISSFEEVLEKARPFCKKETLFFDTCSVKVFPVSWMKKYLPSGSKIIATHPMFGPDSYPQVDRKLAMVMCNISVNTMMFNEWVRYFTAKSLQVELMTPEKHDEMTAYSQGITHYMGRVFADLQLHPTSIDTQGYKMLMEIMAQTCNDSWQLFLDLQRYNPYTEKMREDLQNSIERVNKTL